MNLSLEFRNVVFLVSYPRSGNTWMRYLLTGIQYPEVELTYKNVEIYTLDLHQIGDLIRRNIFQSYSEAINTSWRKSPCIIKSHYRDFEPYNKVIYIYRDGRDVALSYWRFYCQQLKKEITFDSFLDKFIAGDFGVAKGWKEHVESWVSGEFNRQDLIKLKVIKYEELFFNPFRILRDDVVEFLDLEVNDDVIKQTIKKAKYKNMCLDRAKVGQPIDMIGRYGKPGMWREKFNEDQLKKFRDYAGELMEQLGYEV